MSEFKAIETQEQLDAVIGERLTRQKKQFEEKYAEYISPEQLKEKTEGLNKQIADLQGALESGKDTSTSLQKQVEELNAKVKSYEVGSVKTKVAAEFGLPYELSSRLSGDTEEDIRKDAESLSKMFTRKVSPRRDEESGSGTDKSNPLSAMLRDLNDKE